MLTIQDKNKQRKVAKQIRSSLFASGLNQIKSARIVAKILNSNEFKSAKNIALYYPVQSEIDLRELLQIKDKNFYLPRCIGSDMEFVLYQGEDFLINGDYNIKVPIGFSIDPQALDVIYIPALMANKNGFRLGYGKGFYDRFFAKNNLKAKKYIVIAQELISSEFIEDEFDYKCDGIISA